LRVLTASFFSILFTLVLVAPTVISLVDDTQEILVFFDLNEEEENKEGEKGKESKKDAEIKLFTAAQNGRSSLNKIQEKRNIRFRSKYYFSEYSKIEIPPPKTALIS
jgi:hypothetical protein